MNVGIGTREIIAEVARSHGYERLKEEQLIAIVVSGNDVFVSLQLASLMIDQKFRSRRKRSGVCGVTDSRTRLYVTE